MRKVLILAGVTLLSAAASAFAPVPAESGRALGVTRGKPFSSGFVFVNGKYLPPPYVVERWGVGLRVNGQFVSGPVIDWSEFLKTQEGVKVTRTEAAAPAPAPAAAPAAAPLPTQPENEDILNALDDLFDDKPGSKKPKKAPARAAASPAPQKRPPARPRPTVTYSLEGAFVPNAASKALVARINEARSEIDRDLRLGGFFFFGDEYSRVAGDARTAQRLIKRLPEVLQHARSASDLSASARAAGCAYLTDRLCEDLYAHRVDYRALQERRAREARDSMLEGLMP